ncbi:MAG: DMT family transporter [Firmicutes bacterium]|nr:DMT family transporter [Bacillota bacterium]
MESISKNENKNMSVAYLQLVFVSFFWALSTILIKLFITSIPTFHLLMGQSLSALIFLVTIKPKKILLIKKEDIKIGGYAGLFIFGTYFFNFYGLKFTTASKAGFLVSLSVLIIPIFKAFIKKEKPTKWTIITILISLVGLKLISGINGTDFNIGDLIILGTAFSYTFYVLVLDKYLKDKDYIVLSMLQLIFMFILSFIFSTIYEGINITYLKLGIIPIIITGILGIGMAMFFQMKAQRVASPESVGLILLCEPIFTLIMAFFVLKEAIFLKGIIGSGLILIALVLAVVKRI